MVSCHSYNSLNPRACQRYGLSVSYTRKKWFVVHYTAPWEKNLYVHCTMDSITPLCLRAYLCLYFINTAPRPVTKTPKRNPNMVPRATPTFKDCIVFSWSSAIRTIYVTSTRIHVIHSIQQWTNTRLPFLYTNMYIWYMSKHVHAYSKLLRHLIICFLLNTQKSCYQVNACLFFIF